MGVDTVINYRSYCTGCYITFNDKDTCHSDNNHYLIWIYKTEIFVQRFNECYNYRVSVDKNGRLLAFIRDHLSKIVKEEIKPVIYKKIINGKAQLEGSFIDHSDHYQYLIKIGIRLYDKHFNNYDLDTRYEHQMFNAIEKDKPHNINYEYNQHTYLKQFKDFISKMLIAMRVELNTKKE